jgi:hypothetical protein
LGAGLPASGEIVPSLVPAAGERAFMVLDMFHLPMLIAYSVMGQKRITQWREDSWFVRGVVVGEHEVESHALLAHFGSVCIDA